MNQEKDELQKILEGITSERDQLKTDLQKAINMVGYKYFYANRSH